MYGENEMIHKSEERYHDIKLLHIMIIYMTRQTRHDGADSAIKSKKVTSMVLQMAR